MHWIFAVFFALIYTLVVSSLSAVFVWYFFVARLRKRHSETWEALGRPSRFLDARSNNFAVPDFFGNADIAVSQTAKPFGLEWLFAVFCLQLSLWPF